ncbi:MAG TPA: (2Fe-2S) ferredoxin domain-containing protein [Stenomitos sp.]
MDNFTYKLVSEFRVEGQFLGFVSDEVGKLKYLRVGVETSELQIKLTKENRAFLLRVLKPGDQILVMGKKKRDKHTGQFKLKAEQVNKLTLDSQQIIPQHQILHTRPKAKILMCQKSGCIKRGGKRLCQELEATLCDRGLQDQVKIERTGCLKRCSQAPNVVLMPGKTRLSGMRPDAIATLIENL